MLLLMIFVVNKPLKFSHPFSATYCTCTNYELLFQVHVTVKAGQAYPPRFYSWIKYLKHESVNRSRNYCQIQIGIPACAMSSEYFTRTSLYLVRLKIFEWIKFVRRHLHQIQGNWAGRNFVTELRVNSQLITNAEMNLKSTTTGLRFFWFFSSTIKHQHLKFSVAVLLSLTPFCDKFSDGQLLWLRDMMS